MLPWCPRIWCTQSSKEVLMDNHVMPLASDFRESGLSELSAVEQARRIRDGEITSLELVEYYLARIERYDGRLNAMIHMQADAARKDAEKADRERKKGKLRGVFHGVPTAVKDHHMVRFSKTTLGSKSFEWLWSPVDDIMVKSLREAGFIILGKTTMSELGLMPMAESLDGSATRNPWDTERTSGGSSAGAGAAVAAGLLPIAPGSDGAGSVRIPASLNGLFGLKPTRGLVKDAAQGVDPFGMTTVGPIARSLQDLAQLLDVLAGSDGAYSRRARMEIPKLRIGMILETPSSEADPRVVALVRKAAAELEEAGHHVEIRPTPQATLEEFTPVYQKLVSRIPLARAAKLEPTVKWFVESGRKVKMSEAFRRFRGLEAVGRSAMLGLDVVITPTIGVIAPKVGEYTNSNPKTHFEGAATLGLFTAIANVTGQPGLTVPYGSVDGLPVGVQLLARPGDDALLLALAATLSASNS